MSDPSSAWLFLGNSYCIKTAFSSLKQQMLKNTPVISVSNAAITQFPLVCGRPEVQKYGIIFFVAASNDAPAVVFELQYHPSRW